MDLTGKRVLILVEADYQDLEVHYPRLRLMEEGAEVQIVGTGSAQIYKGKYGYPIEADIDADRVNIDDLDAVIIPGGWAPDHLRQHPAVIKLIKKISEAGKIIGCICHGGWVLVSADVVRNRQLTSYIAIRDDLRNAGATWRDAEVVIDGNLITSRTPNDLPAFMRAIIQALKG